VSVWSNVTYVLLDLCVFDIYFSLFFSYDFSKKDFGVLQIGNSWLKVVKDLSWVFCVLVFVLFARDLFIWFWR
jgi:hypothetical protein